MKIKKILKPLSGFILLASVTFLLLSYLEFRQGRNEFLESGPSIEPKVSLTSVPESVHLDQPVALTWNIDTPTPRRVESTTIFYDISATPSALTTSDAPHAPGYAFSLPDYQSGQITSPGTFTATIYPPEFINKLYIRAYALVDGNHYWTPEYTININQ